MLRLIAPLLGIAIVGCNQSLRGVGEAPHLTLSIGKIDGEHQLIEATLIVSNPCSQGVIIPNLKAEEDGEFDCGGYYVRVQNAAQELYVFPREFLETREISFVELRTNECMGAKLNLAGVKWFSPYEKDRLAQRPNILDVDGKYTVVVWLHVDVEDVPWRLRSRAWIGSVESPTCTFVVGKPNEDAGAATSSFLLETSDKDELKDAAEAADRGGKARGHILTSNQ